MKWLILFWNKKQFTIMVFSGSTEYEELDGNKNAAKCKIYPILLEYRSCVHTLCTRIYYVPFTFYIKDLSGFSGFVIMTHNFKRLKFHWPKYCKFRNYYYYWDFWKMNNNARLIIANFEKSCIQIYLSDIIMRVLITAILTQSFYLH